MVLKLKVYIVGDCKWLDLATNVVTASNFNRPSLAGVINLLGSDFPK